MDIFPSLLDLLGLERDFKMDGSSFANVFDGGKLDNRTAFSEGYPYVCIRDDNYKLISTYSKFWSNKEVRNRFWKGSITGSWKRNLLSIYLRVFQDKLYNIKEDKEEIVNIYRQEKEIHSRLKLKLKDILERIPHESQTSEIASIDDEIKKQLKSLGYL
jgi:arylsulfatase A-like enzyme